SGCAGSRLDVSRAQCSMSSATHMIVRPRTPDRAAHDALQTRDLTKLRRLRVRSLRRSRISGAPFRAAARQNKGNPDVSARAAPHPGHGPATAMRMRKQIEDVTLLITA